jgi:hypothetical protein
MSVKYNNDVANGSEKTIKEPLETALDYKDFQAFLVQYETLIPDLVDPKYQLVDRIAAIKELLKQNSDLLAAAAKPSFITAEIFATTKTLPIPQVEAILTNSNELLSDILLRLEPSQRLRYV